MPHCDLGFTLTQSKQNLSVESSYFQTHRNKIGIGERRRTMRIKNANAEALICSGPAEKGCLIPKVPTALCCFQAESWSQSPSLQSSMNESQAFQPLRTSVVREGF